VVLENGTQPIRPPSPRPRRPGERRGVFAFFGQIHPFKGVHCLLSAFDHLSRLPAETTEGIRLIINGAYLELNHPDYVALFNTLLARNSGRVDFAGPYQHEDLSRLMAAVDWVVVPSIWWENSPLVIEEAFAHRRPVICSDIGGMIEKVRPGQDGFHFPVGNAATLAALMLQLTTEDRIWDRLQSTIRRPVTIDESVANHLELYRDH
jgi:glycosyltransferase involved in cell wall biosynthesis